MATLESAWKVEDKLKNHINKNRVDGLEKKFSKKTRSYRKHTAQDDKYYKENRRNARKVKSGPKRTDETVPYTINELKQMDKEQLQKIYRRYAKPKDSDEILSFEDLNELFQTASDDDLENLGMFSRKPGEPKWKPPTTYKIEGFYTDIDDCNSRYNEDLIMLAFDNENDNWLSMHYKAPFKINGLLFNSVYQYAFFKKVERFTNDKEQMLFCLLCDDSRTLSKINLKMNRASTEKEQIYRFTANTLNTRYWNAVHPIDLYRATYAKFKQNQFLKENLLKTNGQLLIQCDGIPNGYGCGYFITKRGIDNRGWRFPNSWQGKNLYGFILMDVRERLLLEEKYGYEELQAEYKFARHYSWEVTRWDNPDEQTPFDPEYTGDKPMGVKQY